MQADIRVLLFFFFEHQLWTRFINQLPWKQSFNWCIFLLCLFCCFSNSFRHLQGKKKPKSLSQYACFLLLISAFIEKKIQKNPIHILLTGTNMSPLGFYFIFEFWIPTENYLSGTQWKEVKQHFWLSYLLHIFLWNINFNVTCFS